MLKNCVFRADVDTIQWVKAAGSPCGQDHGADICRHHRLSSGHG